MGEQDALDGKRERLRKIIFSSPLMSEIYSDLVSALLEKDFERAQRRAEDLFFELSRIL